MNSEMMFKFRVWNLIYYIPFSFDRKKDVTGILVGPIYLLPKEGNIGLFMEVWSSHTPPHPARSNKGIFMVAKNKEGKDSSGIMGKLLYFKAVCLCSIPGPRITNNVI